MCVHLHKASLSFGRLDCDVQIGVHPALPVDGVECNPVQSDLLPVKLTKKHERQLGMGGAKPGGTNSKPTETPPHVALNKRGGV